MNLFVYVGEVGAWLSASICTNRQTVPSFFSAVGWFSDVLFPKNYVCSTSYEWRIFALWNIALRTVGSLDCIFF